MKRAPPPTPLPLSKRREQKDQSDRDARNDRRLLNPKTTREEIHRRWPYEIWLRNLPPNPNGDYTFTTRKVSEHEAIQSAEALQRKEGRKALVFFHPSPDSERVLLWNDLDFRQEK